MLSLPAPPSPSQTTLATTALELGALLSVSSENFDAFARNISQLKPLYSLAPSSSQLKCHVLGLNLMHLLVENRLSEFHAELELLSESEASSPYISFPITLERQLMVGSYDEVLNASSHAPHSSYNVFMENLVETVRDAIADCVEVSYNHMKLGDAANMMKFDTVEELLGYVKERREDWIIEENNRITFQPSVVVGKAEDVPSLKLIGQSLSYATELERIV